MADWVPESTPTVWDQQARRFSEDHHIADCGSRGSHELRLQALLRLPIRSGDTVVDFGCGTGRLADLLPLEVDYLGIDWSAEVVAEAQRRRADRRFQVGSLDDIPVADWVVASGPFNYSKGWSKDETARAFDTMWASSTAGIAVTVLRQPSAGRLSYEPAELLGYISNREWANLELDRSYLPNDLCCRVWRSR